jgi:hypothetical protein
MAERGGGGSAPFGLLTALRVRQTPTSTSTSTSTCRVSLILLPYDFPTFFQLLSRIDAHLRSLPLTSTSSAALQAAPSLYRDLSAFLQRIPAYCAAPLQALLAKQPRLPRLEVKAGEVGVLGVEVMEAMKTWKERARAMMNLEKEEAEKERTREDAARHTLHIRATLPHPHPHTPGNRQPSPTTKKRKRIHKTPWQSEVEALIGASKPELERERELDFLPPPLDEVIPGVEGEVEGEGGGGLTSVFLSSEAALERALPMWRSVALRRLDSLPLLAAAFPPPPRRPSPPSTPLKFLPRSAATSALDAAHSRPLATLSDYQTYLRLHPTLRSVEEGTMGSFGSPFKKRVEEEGVEEKDVLEGRRGEDSAASGKGKGKTRAIRDSLADFVRRRDSDSVEEANERQRSTESSGSPAPQPPSFISGLQSEMEPGQGSDGGREDVTVMRDENEGERAMRPQR